MWHPLSHHYEKVHLFNKNKDKTNRIHVSVIKLEISEHSLFYI